MIHMFERYTEKARRVIFFARYEASTFGSTYIEVEHMLLALVRECSFVREMISPENTQFLRDRLHREQGSRERIPTNVNLPLSEESKRALALGAEEAESLNHRVIDCEHLFAGLLRLPPGDAHASLTEHIGDPEQLLQTVREHLKTRAAAPPSRPQPPEISAARWMAAAMGSAPAEPFAAQHRAIANLLTLSWKLMSQDTAAPADTRKDPRKEALGKLIDWSSLYRLWLIQALTADTLRADTVLSDAGLASQHYAELPWQFVVESWLSGTCLLLRAIAALPAEKASLRCYIEPGNPIPLDQLLSRFVSMAEDTIRQLLQPPRPL